MNSAICLFRFDTISKQYESEFLNLNKEQESTSLYWSESPKITDQRIKYATGKKNVEKLWQEHISFLKQNEK